MKMNSRKFTTFFSAVVLLVASSAFGTERLLVPKADSPTAMVRCGAELESVKKRLGAVQKYVFTGSERLTNMKYCVREAKTEVVDTRNEYRVPAGTVGWLAPDGKVVLEECINEAVCRSCAVPPPVAVVPPAPAPVPIPPPAPPVTVPGPPPSVETTTARLIGARPPAPANQYSLLVNFFRDRPDGYWRNRYLAEKVQGEHTAYFRVFTKHPYQEILQERKSRPVMEGTFYVKFFSQFPSYHELQNPRQSSIVYSETVKTNLAGYAYIPVRIPMENFAVVTVEAAGDLADLVNRFAWVRREDFLNQSNPLSVWFVQSTGLD